MSPSQTIRSEQINSLPLLLGIINDMGIGSMIDAHVRTHGNWEGASVGTVVSIWLSHILMEREHRLVAVREWARDRAETINVLLEIELRETDCTDDRLATILTMLGDREVQAALDGAMVERWVRVYQLPSETVRLDSTSVSVYHEPSDPASLLQLGHSKDHRPDLRQFKAMLATLDPLGLPLMCELVAGQRADDGLYRPAYEAAVRALGTRALLVVGDSKMGALATRGQIVAGGSCYLCAYRPPSATNEIATWVEGALERKATWQVLETVDPVTGELLPEAVIDEWERLQSWTDPQSQALHTWTERVLVVRSAAYQAGLRRRQEQSLDRLTSALLDLRQPPKRGRKRYRTQAELEAVVSDLIACAKLTGVVHATLGEEAVADGTTRWTLVGLWVDLVAWQALVDRLGWQVYVTNTTTSQYTAPVLLDAYHQQAIHERGFARLKTRTLHIRPLFLRDEQRLAGLLWLLALALRVLTLTEYRLRTALAERQETLVGLNPATRSQATTRPTTERVIAAFTNITLTTIGTVPMIQRHVSPLNPPQRHILRLLQLPTDLYERLTIPSSNLLLHLRE